MADSKNMVIKIVSDAKDFVKGMEDALKQIQSASQKAQSFDKIAEDAANLKEQLSQVTENLRNMESATKADTTAVDAQIGALKNNVDNLNRKFDSFRHTFGTLQETVKTLNTDNLNSQMEKMASNMKEVTSQYMLLRKESENFLSNKTNINDITNINQLEKAFDEAKFLFENFNNSNKKDLKGGYSKEYQEAASALFKYAEALIQVDDAYASSNNGNSILSEDRLDSLTKISEEASKVIGSQAPQIRKAIETMFSSIDVGSFFQKQITGTIDSGTKGFLVKGAIEIPVKLKENAKLNISAEVKKIIDDAQKQIDDYPIKFNFEPIDEKDNKLKQAIDSYINDISKRLQEQAQELNNVMGKILEETGIKDTQQNFDGMATSIVQLLANLKDFSKEITDVEKANEKFNTSFSSENLSLYVKNLEEISDSFKKLISAIDNISSKLNKNGLESQFEIVKNKYSNLDLELLMGEKKNKRTKAAQDLGLPINETKEEEKDLELIKEKKKQLRELFSLYSTYQARGGIRPISDLLYGEADEEKIKYINNEYKKYVKNNKISKKKTDKTDLGSDIFIPSGILETDKEQLSEILSLLRDINTVLQNIGQTGINTSNNLKPLINTQTATQTTNNNINPASSKKANARIPKQKPTIPSKKEEVNKQEQQKQSKQEKQIVQETSNTNQTVVDSNKKLAKSAEEAAQAIQQEKTTIKELTKEEKEKKINGLMYHLGNLNDSSKRFTHPFGDEIKSWFTGIKDSGRGWGDGTGLYATKDINSFSQKSLSDKTLEKFYAIDTSDLNLYEAHAEETAKEFNDFIHHLEQFCISMGSNFEGFDTNLEGIDEESLFSTAQKLFPNFNNIFKDFDSFYDWVNQMITLVSKSGIKADGTINSKQMFNFKKEYGTDDIKTRFLKQLGYQGTDLSGTSFGGIQSGNVIFDTVDAKRIVTSGKQIDAVVQQAKNSVINVKEEINKTTEAESKLEKKVEDVFHDLEEQNNKIKNMPPNLGTKSDSLVTKKPEATTKQPVQSTIQEEVTQTKNDIENSEQNILSLISNIKESLDGLRRDLKILAEMIVVIEGATEQKDYIGQINNIKDGITILNILVLELAKNIQSIDFNKINKLEISTTPFDNIVNSLKDITDLIERISGQASKSNLKSQFEYIQNLYNSMVNDKGKFVARGNKNKLQLMYSLYDKYKDAGGQMSLHRLSDSKSNQDKLYRQYDYYKERTKNKISTESIQSNEQLKSENEALKESVKILTEVINNKQKLSSVNESVAESIKSNAKEIENENQKLKENKEKSKKQTSPNFTMVGEPYGEEIIDKKPQKKTAIIPTNKFTMVGEGRKEDNTHTQLRPYKPKDVYEGEFYEYRFDKSLDPDKEENIRRRLKEVYLEEKKDVDERNKTVEEAQLSFKEKIEQYYKEMYLQGNNTGFQFAKSTINFDSAFNLKDATFMQRNPENKNVIEDKYITYFNKDTEELEFIHSNIKVVDNAEQRVASFTKELERNQREREKLSQWIASFNNKTSDNFKQTNQMLELNQFVNNASFINEKTLQRAETLKTELETVYNDVVNNARRGSSSLSPIPNMMFGEVSRRTKLEKAQSVYDKLALNWNAEDSTKGLVNVEKELGILTTYYDALQDAVDKYNTIDENGKRIGNIVEVSNAYGIYNEQLNKVNEQLNRMKIINTEINGNKINNLNNWFKYIPDPEEAQGKIERYSQIYNQFAEAQQRLNELTTNLTRGNDEESAQEYEKTKENIHDTVLELEELKKILSSDSMNINNQMGQVIKQNLPETTDIDELKKVIDEYADAQGKIQNSSRTGLITDREGNQFIKFSRTVQNAKGVVSEFEFIYDKAMGTVAVATKKIQEPESAFKALADELTTKWRGLFTTLASFVGFYRLWGYFKQGVNTVREFDTALTEMQKVSDETISTLQDYQKTTFDTADAIGATALQIQNSTADFMRLGESLKEASESAKVANILMNVSEFESINEATKSLIAMSAAYDDLSKMNIIDKLNEVGNNYAISTSEAATALQSSASALKTAKNDMDEALALITAGNAVVQDANKVGTGMRTIALRLTGTKSAKETLEELGEDTDAMLATQSKLRDTIKEATAVASNNFKGFDILDDNGNYKSTYEIMLGIADIYEEILETDKQFGRNNANLLLESVAGKVRANIAASIFQNPQLLKDAYKSSQEAENSAMEENEKYMDSINGHIAQLQNAYQQLWANSLDRDTINYFIDLGKSILQVVDNVGLLGTAFIGVTSIKSIVGYQSGKGFAYEIIKGSKEAIKYLAANEGAMQSLALKAISTGQAIKGSFSAAIPVIGSVGTAIALVAVAVNAFVEHQRQMRKELLDSTKTTGDEWESRKQSLSDYASQYEELKTKLDSGNLSEQETIDIKQQIYDIQKKIIELNSENVSGIDLINNKLQDQLDIISSISQIEADKIWQSKDYQEGFKIAEQVMTEEGSFAISNFEPNYSTSMQKELSHIIEKYTQHYSVETPELGNIGTTYFVAGNIKDREKRIRAMIKEIEELQKVYSDTRGTINGDEFFEWSGKYLEELGRGLDIIKEAKKEYEQIWLSGLNVQLNKEGNGFVLSNYQKAVSNLEDAYMMNDSKKIKETTYAYEEAVRIKNEFLENPDNTQYLELFDSIDTSLIETKKRYQDTIDLLKDIPTLDNAKIYKKNTKALKKFTDEENKARKAAERLYKLNPDKIDIRNILENDSHAGSELANALKELMDAMKWTTSDADSLIDALVNAGVVHGDVADATNSASDAYNQFSQEIATAIENVSKLNTVLTESVSGAGISTQNIDAFKEMFGDDYVYALERSANGYHINAEKLQTLIDKQNALTNSDYQKTLDAQYDALKRCNDEIIKANNEQKDTSGLLAQRQGILQRIQDTQDLMMAYQASTSAFQTWTNAQSNGNEYDMYDKIANGYDTVKDLIDRGWSGDDTVRSYLDLIYGDSFDAFTASGEECAEMFDNLDKKIEGTSFSIHDFFQFDSSGKITSNGIFNFFDALKEKQEQLGLSDSEKWIKDDGTYDFGFGRDRAAAEQLGMDVEFFQSMLRAAVSAGFELNLDQPMWAMDELRDKAIKAQEDLDGFNDIDFEELYNNLDDEDAYETISGHIDDVYDYIQKIEDSDLSPELKTQQIEQAQDMLSYLVALEREAADKGDINLKTTVVGSAKEELSKLIEETDELPDALKQYNWDEITDKDGLQKARNYIAAEIEGGRINSESAEAFLNILDQALYELNLIDEYEANPTFKGNTVGAFNDVKQAREELEKYIADTQQLEQDYDIKFNFSEDENVKKLLSIIYGEGTPEILTSLNIDPNKTPEEIIEMLELGERDVDVLFKPDSSELEKQTPTTTTTVEERHTTTDITNEERNVTTSFAINDDNYEQRLTLNEQRLEQLDSSKVEVEIRADDEQYNQTVEEAEKNKKEVSEPVTTKFKGDTSDVVSKANSASSVIYSLATTVTTTFKSSGLGNLKDSIQEAINKINHLDSRISTVSNRRISGFVEANGTAHVYGTAFSRGSAYTGGKWGLSNNQTALTGELGTEIVVRDGNWFTVGDNGAEFVNLKKGDIVFNHKQAQELLENGYVTSNKGRGHLVGFANGTAYSSGNTSGATRARVATSSSKSSSSRSSGGSGGSGGSNGGNSSSKDAKETKNTLDEVEILIGRIEARISDLDKIIGSTYNTWEDRNDSILDNLKLVTQEISDQRKAYTTYMNKANSVSLSESWKQKIRDGAFRIEDVTDSDLWDKIQEYQTYYNKAVASEQALIDLTNKRGELYKQLFDNTQTYYDNMVEAIQHEIDVQDTFIDRLEEAGRLSSKILIYRQYDQEQRKLVKLNEELQTLRQREKDALNSGYIEYGSEAWSEMESAIADVCASIEEAENNLISYDKALNEVDWNRWDRIHDSIDGVVNELEFIYDLMNEDDLFNEQGDITDQGTTALALLAHEYDVYFAEVQEYQKEINQVQEDLAKDPYNQTLVDKLKELKEAQQDAASGAKKMKESIVDVTEKGIKKQIDYVKKLIEDYEELLETQKDQIDYAKKVADQQKELNKLEKQYRAIQNDNSEEGATKRQQLRNQIEEARQNLKDTQDDRRLSETKDMLSKFEESLEDFLDNKLKDIEGTVREAINTANNNRNIIKDTINNLTSSYGYSPSDTLKSTLEDMNRSFVSYFDRQFEDNNVASIADNVSKIVDYYQRVQSQSNQEATIDTMTEAVRHDGNIQTYRDENGNTVTGYFRSDGTRDETYTGWAEKAGKQYRFENGQQLTGAQFINVGGSRYHLDDSGAVQTGWQKVNDKWYYMNNQGQIQTGWQKMNDKWYYMNSQGEMQIGAQKIGGKQYVFDESGAMLAKGWKKYNGQWYHLGAGGIADTGWLKDNGKWYYLNSQGAMQTGVQRIGNKTYIMDSSGAMLSSGWQKANNNWYYLDSNGSAKTGWQNINGKWYLLDNQGIMKTGFYSESGKTYYMDGSGAMQTGWQKINGQWYYFNSKGQAASGWAELKWGSNTDWYYFDPETKAMLTNTWIDKGGVTDNPQKGAYYVNNSGAMVKNGRRSTNKGWLTFEKDGKWTGYKTGTSGVGTSGLYWTNEGNKAEAIIRKSDGAILTPLSKGDSVIPNSAMKNMYQALTDPAKYLKQYTAPDVRVIQNNSNSNNQPPIVNMQFIANGVQDANKFVNDLMNNKKLEKWVQEVTLGQANGNNNYKKYSYIVR